MPCFTTAFIIPRPNSILIPHSTGLNLIEGRKHLLNRQLIYTSAFVYLSFKNLVSRAGALLETPLPTASPYRVDRRGVPSPSLGSLAGLAV